MSNGTPDPLFTRWIVNEAGDQVSVTTMWVDGDTTTTHQARHDAQVAAHQAVSPPYP